MNVPLRPPKQRLPVDEADLRAWLAVAAPGDALAYYRGRLVMDRSIGSRLGEVDRKELGRVADAAMILARSGHVRLVQRRHGPDDYTYIAIASPSIGRSPARTPMSEAAS